MMFGRLLPAGLRLPAIAVPPPLGDCPVVLTDEAALVPGPGEELRVEPLVAEGAAVAQGQPLLRLRAAPEIALVAPMAGRVARIELAPGRRLVQLVLFHEGGDRHRHDPADAGAEAGLRALMQAAGLWRALRSRPFGHMPRAGERPAAIFVMAADTRPGAPDPRMAITGREEDFAAGCRALARLTQGQVWICDGAGDLPVPEGARVVRCGGLHPQGLPGIRIHRLHPARTGAPVWDIHAEDVADLGALLATGLLPETRLVAVTGAALREARLLRCQPGADLRGLAHGFVKPGPHELLSGSALDGRRARWLGPCDRQACVLPQGAGGPHRHWFAAALRKAARPMPVIPTAALDQAMGGGIPAAALVRALASGDAEAAVRLGALSLLEEDLALADYVTGAEPRISAQLRAVLDAVEAEEAPE